MSDIEFNLSNWFKDIKKGETLFEYSGVITSDMITEVLEDVESVLAEKDVDGKLIRKIYNVLVEGLQNLYHHSLPDVSINGKGSREKFGAFVVKRMTDGVTVSMGNYVEKRKVQILKDRINQINSLTKDELKSLYKMILNNQEFSEKGGGGLGMIDMAKRTGGKLDFVFYTVNDNYSFYNLNIFVS